MMWARSVGAMDPWRTPSSFSSTPHAPRIKKPYPYPAGDIPAGEPNQNGKVYQVQPYRRRRKMRDLPQCVPLLDLTQFNVPDTLMDPIHIEVTTINQLKNRKTSASNVGRNIAATAIRSCEHTHNDYLKNTVESKILSIERSKTAVYPIDCRDQRKNTQPVQELSRRLRFEARIATQNGRDVHHDLCGFYFLTDGSITLYEFRQFGKKINALPLIQRGVYHRCSGSKKGKPYEIGHISKGATLQFETKSHPGLSDSLVQTKFLSVIVSYVDEQVKRQLLCEGCNHMQCVEVDKYLSVPLVKINLKEDNMLHTLQGMFRNRLQGRACKTLVGLGRHLEKHADKRSVSFIHLQLSLRKFHISLTTEDMQHFWQLLSKIDVFNEELEMINLDSCLQALTGGLCEDRNGLIRRVFKRMDSRKTGHIDSSQMKKFFVHVTESSSIWSEMFDIFNLENRGSRISFADFENFHLGASIEIPSDSDFFTSMKTHWQI